MHLFFFLLQTTKNHAYKSKRILKTERMIFMKEINTKKELEEYLIKLAEKESKDKNIISNTPFINSAILHNTEDVMINGNKISKGDKFYISSNGNIIPIKANQIDIYNEIKPTYKKSDLNITGNDKTPYSIPIKAKSSYLNAFEHHFKENKIPAVKSEFVNSEGKEIITLSFAEKFANKVKDIAKSIQTDKNINKNDGEKVYDNETLYFSKSQFLNNRMPKTDDKYLQELERIPEQELDHEQVLLKEIHDSIIKCEVYLGEMREASIKRDTVAFNKSKTNLQKEHDNLKALETELVKTDTRMELFEKIVAINTINEISHEIDKQIDELSITNIKKLPTKEINGQELKSDYYALHVKAMLDMKENLSMDELIGTVGNASTIHTTSEKYKPETMDATKFSQGIRSIDGSVSDAMDGHYEEYRPETGDSVANSVPEKEVNADDILDAPLPPPHYDFDDDND